MRVRIEAGSDVARLGVWDAARQGDSLANVSTKTREQAEQADVADGRLFVINTGADGTDAIDVLIDEPPTGPGDQFRQAGKEHLLVVTSGRINVDGLEYYRVSAETAPMANLINLPSGDYGITCRVNTDKEVSLAPPTEEALRTVVGEADHRYYARRERGALIGCLGFLLFPALWPFIGWKWALGFTLAVLVPWSHFREWQLKRDARYQAIVRKRQEYWKRSVATGPATMQIVLRRLHDRTGLKGGAVRVHES